MNELDKLQAYQREMVGDTDYEYPRSKFCADCGRESKQHVCNECCEKNGIEYAGFDRCLKYECKSCHQYFSSKDTYCIWCGAQVP